MALGQGTRSAADDARGDAAMRAGACHEDRLSVATPHDEARHEASGHEAARLDARVPSPQKTFFWINLAQRGVGLS